MLSLISPAEAATPAHAPSRMGASVLRGCAVAPRVRAVEPTVVTTTIIDTIFARPRPQAVAGTVLFGNATHAAGQADSAGQQRTSQKYAHTTRIAAAGGGAVGPHPARDPV